MNIGCQASGTCPSDVIRWDHEAGFHWILSEIAEVDIAMWGLFQIETISHYFPIINSKVFPLIQLLSSASVWSRG